MTAYTLEAHRDANRELRALPPKVADGIRRVLHDLAANPVDARFDLKPIQGHSSRPPTLRLRIGGFRVLLKVSHERRLIRVLRIGRRATVYRGLDHLDEGIE